MTPAETLAATRPIKRPPRNLKPYARKVSLARIERKAMTDHDLATVREWCKANGVEVRKTKWEAFAWEAFGLPEWFPKDASGYAAHFEQQVYDLIWRHLAPWLASVRNLDAVEVEGPYSVHEPIFGKWGISYHSAFLNTGSMSEQTARRIANILNRECGDGN